MEKKCINQNADNILLVCDNNKKYTDTHMEYLQKVSRIIPV